MKRESHCIVLALSVLAVLGGCAKRAAPPAAPQAGFVSSSDSDGDGTAPGNQRLMIRSGSLDLRVKDLDEARSRIEGIVENAEGRIDNWSTRDDTWLEMTLGVPEPRLDETMDRLADLGKVGLEARLRNLQALRGRLRSYLGHLGQALNLEEILKVERELARVQTEIESIEGRLNLLKNQVAMSELEVRVRKKGWS